ncbi:MAG: histidinol-phosphate transaminase [Candidatus Dormibacteria bacterium]|jgi:histidinol-phosphate aminotransferase
MSRYRRASLGSGSGYVPGEQPPDDAPWIKLNTNESPLPPSPSVGPAVERAVGSLHRYPHPQGEPLRSALARHHGLPPESVILGNGADQILESCFRAFADPGDTVVLTRPTYSLLSLIARLGGARVVTVPLGDAGSMPDALGATPGVMRLLCNPNSPTGSWAPPAAVAEALPGSDSVVVIDEAYCDFAPASCVPLLADHANWLVVRTFAKSYGLAGLRVGYALGHPDLIADLSAVIETYPVDRLALAAAGAALADQAHHARIVEMVVGEREPLAAALRGAGWDVIPSQANFVLGRPPGGDAARVLGELRQQGVLVRRFPDGDHGDRLRITIGTPDQNRALLAALGIGA